jgi:3-isopropylmalate/(R)-2-methylmalate dehydratase small subunit
MEPFKRLSSRAVAILDDDIDTDVIYPASFLLLREKTGLGACFFADRREEAKGRFVLDRPESQGAAILIAGDNFSSGSSREYAVWALVGAGVRCVPPASARPSTATA